LNLIILFRATPTCHLHHHHHQIPHVHQVLKDHPADPSAPATLLPAVVLNITLAQEYQNDNLKDQLIMRFWAPT
jgi:hypothetical protein